MAKSTRYNGDSYTAAEMADPDAPIRIRRAELGKVDRPSAPMEDGTDCSLFSGSESKPDALPTPHHQAPAPTTENPSKARAGETDSSAVSTVGATRKTPQRQSGKSAKKDDSKKARVSSVEDEFDAMADELFE